MGRKILISGGGRCNFTNLHCGPGNFISDNVHFAKSALALYEPRNFIELVERYGIHWHEKTLGQLFCDHSARSIVEMLLAECARGGVETVLNARRILVEGAASGGFRVACSLGEFTADALVVATGGLSIPKMGATGIGYELARQFGLKMVNPRPALVPLLLGGEEDAWTELAGVATEVVVHTSGAGRKAEFREKMLLTHRGLSGPAVLQVSSYWRAGDELHVDFAPEIRVLGALMEPRAVRGEALLRQALREVLPQRLAGLLAERCDPGGWSNAALEGCERRLHAWRFHPTGTEGFDKAEVTAGGVDTSDLNAQNDGGSERSGIVFYWRSRGCDRMAGRIQLSVGVGVGCGGGSRCVRLEREMTECCQRERRVEDDSGE